MHYFIFNLMMFPPSRRRDVAPRQSVCLSDWRSLHLQQISLQLQTKMKTQHQCTILTSCVHSGVYFHIHFHFCCPSVVTVSRLSCGCCCCDCCCCCQLLRADDVGVGGVAFAACNQAEMIAIAPNSKENTACAKKSVREIEREGNTETTAETH